MSSVENVSMPIRSGPIGNFGPIGIPGEIGINPELYYFFLKTYKHIIFPDKVIKKSDMIKKVKSELNILDNDDLAIAKSKLREYKINKLLSNG